MIDNIKPMPEGKLRFQNICRENGIDISAEKISALSQYVGLLLEWNRKINLISRRDEENIWIRHILGSIAILISHRLKENTTIVDVGTGGGLPGIPLAICCPACSFVLVDSIQKKIKAVADIISAMNLPNVSAIPGRAEELARTGQHRGRYDYVTARAVAPVIDIIRWCSNFVSPPPEAPQQPSAAKRGDMMVIPTGTILLLKGGDVSAELETAGVKFRRMWNEVTPLLIRGTDSDDLSDKKLIVIGFNRS